MPWKYITEKEWIATAPYLIDKYHSMLIVKKDLYPLNRKRVKQERGCLKDGDIINCEVIGFDEKKNMLFVKWILEFDTDIAPDPELKNNNLPDEMIEKLQILKSQIQQEQDG